MTSGNVSITFDDSLASVYSIAFPEMERLDLIGTVFVISSFVGKEYMGHPVLTEEMLVELCRKGWEIGSHTKTHPRLGDLSVQQVNEELEQSKKHLESVISGPVTSLAYPYGEYDSRVASLAARYYLCARALSCYPPLKLNTTAPRNRMTLNAMSSYEPSWTLPSHLFYHYFPRYNMGALRGMLGRAGSSRPRIASPGSRRSLDARFIGRWIECMGDSDWLILCFHNVTTRKSPEPFNISLGEFRKIVKVVSERTHVSTLKGMYGMYIRNHIEAGHGLSMRRCLSVRGNADT